MPKTLYQIINSDKRDKPKEAFFMRVGLPETAVRVRDFQPYEAGAALMVAAENLSGHWVPLRYELTQDYHEIAEACFDCIKRGAKYLSSSKRPARARLSLAGSLALDVLRAL